MNTVRRGKGQVKGEEPKRVTLADFALHAPAYTLVESLQALIPLGLMAVGDCLKADVARLAGARCRRGDGLAGHVRWGRQRGSVYLADQKLPIQVPRVRNRLTGQEALLFAGDVHALAEAARGRCRTVPPGAEGAELSGL